tara:strand:- start:233 stop:883 length:651 start_codon:yes stop_codon:yes gene_type:complete
MKTFNQFQESVAAAAIKGGSKLVPALMTGIGAAGMIMQARRKNKKRKIGAMEKRLMDRENNVRDNDMIIAKPGEVKKQNKLIDKYTRTESAIAIKAGSKLVPALMTGIGASGMIMQSKKRKVPKDSEGMPDELSRLGRKAKVTLKKGMRDFKKGLVAGQEVPRQGAKGRFSNPNAKLVRDMMKDKAKKGDSYAKRFLQQMKDKRTKNKDIDDKLGI